MNKNNFIEIAKIFLDDSYNRILRNTGVFENENFDYEILQKSLSKLNENQEGKKEKGVYYTPDDVCDFITANSFASLLIKNHLIADTKRCINDILSLKKETLDDFLFKKTVFDPTSGSGEFLVSALRIKLGILKSINSLDSKNAIKIIKTIYGNDINHESNSITLLRLVLMIEKYLTQSELIKVSIELKNNFTLFDMTQIGISIKKHNILIGNPPYVEKGKFSKYGNIYADVLDNACSFVENKGTFGFIIPISFVSTPRMKEFRELIQNKFKNVFVMNYADRPSCLFNKVHQKLTILLCNNNCDSKAVFTSKYNYWYKHERHDIFNKNKFVELKKPILDCYPKISDNSELHILEKIISENKTPLEKMMKSGNDKLFLNMRGFFWMKAFTFNPGSSEYKEFNCDSKYKKYLLSILNSSLFFFYWVSVSDCWHITGKELNGFMIKTDGIDFEKYDKLFSDLENKLEKTKEYIGTKQVDYAYKHKLCKELIDRIDDQLVIDYGFNSNESEIIKNFALKYRIGE